MTFRLAHVYNHLGGGGGANQARTLLRGWGDHGIDAWGVHAANIGAPESFISEKLDYPLMYPSDLQDGLRELEPDVVFVHGYSDQLNEMLKDLSDADDFDAKFVLRKGMNLLEYWLGTPADGNPAKVTQQVSNLDWYDLIICPTHAVAERTQLCYGDGCPPLYVVPNAIDRDEYVPSSFMQNGWLHVITASRIAPNNYILSPLLAALRIIEEGTFPIKLDVCGPANQPLGEVIGGLAEEHDEITLHGKLDHDEMRTYMETADVVAIPSLSHQAVPLAAVEGMAAGNVILGSFHEAHEEPAIVHVPAAHPPAWYDALTDAYADPDDAREWVRKGIENAANYDVERVIGDGYLPVFDDLLAEEMPTADD